VDNYFSRANNFVLMYGIENDFVLQCFNVW